jgi:hypothetical protein
LEEWEAHFSRTLNEDDPDEVFPMDSSPVEGAFKAVIPQEVAAAKNARNGRAAGSNRILYEHTKDTQEMLLKHWMNLFNNCVQLLQIPQA